MRRRKHRVSWFPNLGTAYGDENPYITTTQQLELIPELSSSSQPGQVSGSLLCVPVTQDYTQSPDISGTVESLRDFVEGQDYLLKRIVGSCHAYVNPQVNSTTVGETWPLLILTAGFLVARAIDADQTAVGLDDADVDPYARQNIQQPWIWRRQWLLSNPGAAENHSPSTTGRYAGIPSGIPSTNLTRGTLREGSFIDSKIARRITKEHRLWFSATAQGLSLSDLTMSGARNLQPIVQLLLDIRILGAMRRGKNVSSF